ncbi:MAG: LLM class flavin-dependent oxidoreductase [Chloroflexi bacterium]|nr:LLM class flavin-dependent oxidoreductase [Chloroflexota bacterium]
MALPVRLRFGVFLPPHHLPGTNPTLAYQRDLELLQRLDALGFDEAFVGEHHSGGWELIQSPEMFIAVAAERTRHLKLGTGVISLPYHHPLTVANRMVLLDHLTRGRTIFGIGPGSLVSDAAQFGIDPRRLRPMMEESFEAIYHLLTSTEPLTVKTDWFELHDALLHVRPYTQPHMPFAVTSVESPSGMLMAGKYGAAPISFSVFAGLRGRVDLNRHWQVAEESAARYGRVVRREDWRLVIPVHVAESRQEAIEQVRHNAGRYLYEYVTRVVGRGPSDLPEPDRCVDEMVARGSWVVGTPDDLVAAIQQIGESSGGFGSLLIQAHNWASRDAVLRSYDTIAAEVMPRFQNSLVGKERSADIAAGNVSGLIPLRNEAVEQAHRAYETRH